MTDSLPAAHMVAVVKPCEQYRFRVELPRTLDRKVRADIRRRALLEINESFLDCTRTYQAMAWLGPSNLSFADSRHSPSDSKSEFLHLLICMKIIELSFIHCRDHLPAGEAPAFTLEFDTFLPGNARRSLMKLCDELGIQWTKNPDLVAAPRGRVRIGGVYRSSRHAGKPFSNQPVKTLEMVRGWVIRCLTPWPPVRRVVNILLRTGIFLFWPIPIAARAIFSFYYRAAAARVLRRLNGPRNVLVYFDLRLGRNRDIAAYLRWKFGAAFNPSVSNGLSYVPFSHIARPGHAYSVEAMVMAYRALKRMERDPLSGCVIVNYLLPSTRLLEVNLLRNGHRRKIRRKLVELEQSATDFFKRYIYKEFINSLDFHHAFPVEVSACYDAFFGALAPGVVVQADAIAKTARHFTASARRRGNRVVYVADRICTSLRTSNQLISDDGDNPHLPNLCVVFDQVSKEEFVRQGMPAGSIYSYCRNFASDSGVASEPSRAGQTQVVILLQAYEDHIGGMVHLGEEIARKHPELTVLYQEHPNFPVCHQMKSALLKELPGRLRFLESGEPVDFAHTLAQITGYSTAAVPGILHGVPLIWLRRQIDNSIYGEAYLNRIGFAADKSDEVNSILKRLIRRDPTLLEACAAATAEANAIFTSSSTQAAWTFPQALTQALDDSFAEIAASGRPLAAVKS